MSGRQEDRRSKRQGARAVESVRRIPSIIISAALPQGLLCLIVLRLICRAISFCMSPDSLHVSPHLIRPMQTIRLIQPMRSLRSVQHNSLTQDHGASYTSAMT